MENNNIEFLDNDEHYMHLVVFMPLWWTYEDRSTDNIIFDLAAEAMVRVIYEHISSPSKQLYTLEEALSKQNLDAVSTQIKLEKHLINSINDMDIKYDSHKYTKALKELLALDERQVFTEKVNQFLKMCM